MAVTVTAREGRNGPIGLVVVHSLSLTHEGFSIGTHNRNILLFLSFFATAESIEMLPQSSGLSAGISIEVEIKAQPNTTQYRSRSPV